MSSKFAGRVNVDPHDPILALSHTYPEALAAIDVRTNALPPVAISEVPFDSFAQASFECLLRMPSELLAEFPSIDRITKVVAGRSATNVISRSRGPTESGENSSTNAQIARTTEMLDFSQLPPTL